MEGFESKTDSGILDTYWIKREAKDNHQKFFEPKQHYHHSRK